MPVMGLEKKGVFCLRWDSSRRGDEQSEALIVGVIESKREKKNTTNLFIKRAYAQGEE